MKILWQILPPAIKAIVTVCIFFVSLGWAAYGAILLIVKAEGQELKKEVMEVRSVDIQYITERFDRLEVKLDRALDKKED